MTNILPVVDWAAEALRPTLLGILRRLDKTFNKIYKKPSIRVSIINKICNQILKYDIIDNKVKQTNFKTFIRILEIYRLVCCGRIN